MNNDSILSVAGQRQRERILQLALRESRRIRRRRRMIRGSIAGAAMIAATLPLLFRMHQYHAPTPGPARYVRPTSPPPSPVSLVLHRRQEITITRINTDPGLTKRLAAPASSINIERVGDDQLLKELADANQPAGLAYVGPKRMLLFRDSDGRQTDVRWVKEH